MKVNNVEEELIYWMMIANLRGWRKLDINRLIVDIILRHELTLSKFISLPKSSKIDHFNLSTDDVDNIHTSLLNLNEYKIQFSRLYAEGISIIPLNSKLYSRQLKKNLKMAGSPPVMYCCGNPRLLNYPSVAIVGSRKAGKEALDFTETLTKKLIYEGKVIVSGFAKGVDRTALQVALENQGYSIIVLPQGILSFKNYLHKFKHYIDDGKLLVVSTFPPESQWTIAYAMERNAYIYGLSSATYIAETGPSGGTWSGAINALNKKLPVNIYFSRQIESNALLELIRRGAKPVDEFLNPVTLDCK